MCSLFRDIKYLSRDAFFIVLQQIGVVIRSFGITWILAQLGNQALAAGALTLSQFSIYTYFLMGTLAAVSILAARTKGAGKIDEIGQYVKHGIFLSIFLAIPLILVFITSSHFLYRFEQSQEITALAIEYVKFLAWALVPFSIFIVLQQFLLSISKFKLTMFFSLVGIFLVLFVSYLLALGKLGLPSLGIKGLGIASIIAYCSIAIYLWTHVSKKSYKSFSLFKNFFHLQKHYFYEIWHLGWPLGAKWSIEIGIFLVIAVLIGRQNANQLAMQQVLLLFVLVSGAFSAGIDQATMIRFSQALGEGNFKYAKKSGTAGLILGIIIATLIAIGLLLYFKKIIYIFFPVLAEQVNQNFIYLIVIVALFQIFDSIRTIATGLLASLKDTKFAFWMEVISFWVIGLSVGNILSVHHSPIFSYWTGLLIGIFICALALFLRYQTKLKALNLHDFCNIPSKTY